MLPIPADFERHFRRSPVTDAWEPLFSRRRSDGIDLAFEVREPLCNSRGFLHGGVLATLCDNAMGSSVGLVLSDPRANIVTVNLALDYLGSAKLGDGVMIESRVLRAGETLCVCDALVKNGDELVARANASFSVRLMGTKRS